MTTTSSDTSQGADMADDDESWIYIIGRIFGHIFAILFVLLMFAVALSIGGLIVWWLFDQVLIPFYQYLRLG